MAKVLRFPSEVALAKDYNTQLPTDSLITEDILKMSEKLGITHEECIKVAKDFYNQYPFLVEYVRDFNNFGSIK